MTSLSSFVLRDPGAAVLVVTNMWPDDDWPVYGIFVRRQVDALRSAGIPCDVFYVRGYRSKLAYLGAALRFAWWNVRPPGRYRVVHVHAGETSLVARLLMRAPVVATFHGDDIMGDRTDRGSVRRTNRIKASMIRLYGNLFPATIVQSREMYDKLPMRVRRRSRIIACGTDPISFAPIDRDSARSAIGYSGPEHLVLFAAIKPDSPNKRRHLAEAAVAQASEELGSVELLISGETPPERMPLLMNAADCLLHTASFEGSPNVVREALMCNLPVVATPSGDLEMLLDGVEPSRLCRPDAVELGEAIVSVLSTKKRSNGRAEKFGQISSSAAAAALIDLYEELASRAVPRKEPLRTSR